MTLFGCVHFFLAGFAAIGGGRSVDVWWSIITNKQIKIFTL